MVIFGFIEDLIVVRLVSGVIGGGNCAKIGGNHKDRMAKLAKRMRC
jgi:hypothetical protein